MRRFVEIMDTTLRDGEQTSGVSFTAAEKLHIAKLLLENAKVDRIEVASARVSAGEMEGVKKITNWANANGFIDKIEVLGFVDTPKSVNWIVEAGAKVLNLLCKGSKNHLTHQLKKTEEEHKADIIKCINYANEKGLEVNVYLEDWSNGMRNSKEYAMSMIDFLTKLPVKRILLPDTLGILEPIETNKFILEITSKYPNTRFDFHPHNDYDLSVANSLGAIMANIGGIHTTINGMGERAGNVPLASLIAAANDHLEVEFSIDESQLYRLSKIVEGYSGIRIPNNKPIVGDNVFTQTAGIHADGDNKKSLYFNDLLPERFGRKRKYALGKTSGKANIQKNLDELGIILDDREIGLVTQRVIELGDKKENVTTEDLPYIIADVLDNAIDYNIKVENYSISCSKSLNSMAILHLDVDGVKYQESGSGDGQYDAFMNALKNIYTKLNRKFPVLLDYSVRIPPGGKTDALCECTITWKLKKEFRTSGLDSDQTVAAIKATEKMLNIIG